MQKQQVLLLVSKQVIMQSKLRQALNVYAIRSMCMYRGFCFSQAFFGAYDAGWGGVKLA